MMRRLHSSRRFSGSLLALALGLALPLAHAADKPAAGKPAASQPAASKPQAGEQFVDGIAAIVNKDVITMREVQDGVKRAKVDLKERGIQLPDDKVLQKQVLQRLIFDRLERQEADRLGIRVDDAQVTQAINMVASRNKLTPQQLRAEVEKNGLSWDDYRKSLREEIRTDRLRQRTIDNHIIITDAEVDAYLKDQARNPALQPQSAQAPVQEAPAAATGPVMLALGQILVRVPEGASPDTVASLRKKAEDILARLKRGDDFASVAAASSDGPEALEGGVMGVRPIDGWPDLFVKAVSNVPAGQVSGIIQSGNGFHILKVLQRGQAGAPAPARAAAPMPAPAAGRAAQGPVQVTQTHARHILIKTSAVMSDQQARQRLEQVRQRLESGSAKFEDMARQYSQDATAPQGGDLGWVNPGEMVPSFEAAMNSLKPGEISQPIESPFGWHLVQVLERRQKDVTDEMQRMQARQALFERRAGPAFEDWMEQLRAQAYIDNRLEKQERIEQNNR
ncbi:peptidylprolyl isomerase [Bordetella avium]|uniref:peptidylprolyl isomerase n=13 Tax=Bordetella avium TaxID=521 RepID=UPI000E0AEC84|nr:peptidylprolyl isomerase [Bordetella avium]AZY51623.1 molecular chaperone SurA [Bordetella avium]RIQ13515.1 molecular chaperone SurA [Bordetella avium]RIQ16530.1 molecular chaperone SurA [Bordetella avium]RIQ31289.1 molecular chaperone SurA [Bordetella avium]RIQ36861.1 molecular chaperone SurA [Bordetella avium]